MNTQTKSILVIDDNKTFVMYAGLLLKRMGYEVIPTGSALEALKLLKMMAPDAVILDVNMPTMDGISLLRQIQSDPELVEVPVIMASTDSSGKTKQESRRLGAAEYLLKPLTPDSLHRAIQAVLTPDGVEKRRHFRIAFAGKVTVKSATESQELFAVNLSQGGIYLRKKEPLQVGTQVEIHIAAGERTDLRLSGMVIYKKDIYDGAFTTLPGMAIQFKTPAPQTQEELKSFINELAARDLLEEQEEVVITIQ
ncbi:hypothetical protein DESUT3_31300 [Desulfuromonas versatilis]|uniref:Response regulatory domain-containing protein n=1 Tax=Desulfuromonas versatilis TaxID=2802975 RepID=A0ABM8HZC3_9BACT|nr:response regulator [Desulfuromonas versatilis]BCR06061.1 hypothetical protein DESUT3_31300 [Desulfuromonas versatilis]